MEVYIKDGFIHVKCDSFQQTLEIEKPEEMALMVEGCNFDFRDSLAIRLWCWITGRKRDTVGVLIKNVKEWKADESCTLQYGG